MAKKKDNYVIKEETYNAIKEEMKSVLGGYSYKKDYALDVILRAWIKAKQPLFNILSKHPNWNDDKLLIQFETDYSREFNTRAIDDFRNYLRKASIERRHVYSMYDLPQDEYDAIYFIGSIRTQFFEEDNLILGCIDNLNRTNDAFKLRPNMKSSKAIGKICNVLKWNEFEDYNKQYATLCDALNPIKVVRHTCISLNPIDFLLMSNGNSWTSCHRIKYANSSGESLCTSGTISYMLDPCSFVFYTVDSSFNGKDIELEPKLQRQMFGYNDNTIFQSRLYPQTCDSNGRDTYKETREIVQKVISDCLDIPNYWVKIKDTNFLKHVKSGASSTAYPDFKYQRGICSVSIHKSMIDEKDKLKVVSMGRKPICIRCGERHATKGSLYCSRCY